MAERPRESQGISFNLPEEVYFPYASAEGPKQVDVRQLAIAGFVDTEFGRSSLWPKPLLFFEGQTKNVSGDDKRRLIEYYSLGQNYNDGNWVLCSGWENLVAISEDQPPYLWSGGEGNMPAYLFQSRAALQYNAKVFERSVKDVIRSIQSLGHIGSIGLSPFHRQRQED